MTGLILPLLVLWLQAEWRAWSAHRDFMRMSTLCDRMIALYEAAEADGAEADRALGRWVHPIIPPIRAPSPPTQDGPR